MLFKQYGLEEDNVRGSLFYQLITSKCLDNVFIVAKHKARSKWKFNSAWENELLEYLCPWRLYKLISVF